MPLLPELEPIVQAAAAAPRSVANQSVSRLRAAAHADMERSFLSMVEKGPEVASVVDHEVPVDGGTVRVRVYTPHGAGPFGAHVYFHGGGFWLGTVDHFDDSCREVARGAGCVVASVEYRLAPEHRFPTAAQDCYAALCWVVDHADQLQVDPGRVSVGGSSAGGNLAAVVSLMARDRGGPAIILQVLEIPVTDLTLSQPSMSENGEGYVLTRAGMDACRRYYAREADFTHPYASPLLAEDLAGLPPAVVMTAEYDPLRDEGEAYARRLDEAGVVVEATRWEGHIHGSMSFTKLLASARQYRDEVIGAVKRAHARRSAGT